MPSLVLIIEGFERYVYPLGKATLLIGRRGEADIQLPSDAIDHDHASIVLEEGKFILRDNGSTNGSYVNGEKVSRKLLKHLDLVRFGNYIFLVSFIDMTLAETEPPVPREVQLDVQTSSPELSPFGASQAIGIKLSRPSAITRAPKNIRDQIQKSG